MNKITRYGQQGTTVVEMMGVVAILGAIITVAVPAMNGHEDRMRLVEVQKDFGVMELRIQRYLVEHGEYPESLEMIGLVKKDPWGNPYEYLRKSDNQGNGDARKKQGNVPINTDFDLYSTGPDGSSRSLLTSVDSRDDIVRAEDGSFTGWATDYCAKTAC